MSEFKDAMKEARKRAKIDGLKLKSKINIENYKSQIEKEFDDLVENVFTGKMIEAALYTKYLSHTITIFGGGTYNSYLDAWRASSVPTIRSYVQDQVGMAILNGKCVGPNHFTEVLILFLQELALSQAIEKVNDPVIKNILSS